MQKFKIKVEVSSVFEIESENLEEAKEKAFQDYKYLDRNGHLAIKTIVLEETKDIIYLVNENQKIDSQYDNWMCEKIIGSESLAVLLAKVVLDKSIFNEVRIDKFILNKDIGIYEFIETIKEFSK